MINESAPDDSLFHAQRIGARRSAKACIFEVCR